MPRALLILAALSLAAGAPRLAAQSSPAPAADSAQAAATAAAPAARLAVPPKRAITINPLYAIAYGIYTGEFERSVGPSSTVALGASYWDAGGDGEVNRPGEFDARISYFTSDLRLRYYPGGTPLRGVSFGASAGYVRLGGEFSTDSARWGGHVSGPSIGTELAYNRVLDDEHRVTLALGVGAKRIWVRQANNVSAVYPTLRLGVGLAF